MSSTTAIDSLGQQPAAPQRNAGTQQRRRQRRPLPEAAGHADAEPGPAEPDGQRAGHEPDGADQHRRPASRSSTRTRAVAERQFVQMQALQGASLVGRDVTVDGQPVRPRRQAGSQAASSSPARPTRCRSRCSTARAWWSTRSTSARRAAAATASTGSRRRAPTPPASRFRVSATLRQRQGRQQPADARPRDARSAWTAPAAWSSRSNAAAACPTATSTPSTDSPFAKDAHHELPARSVRPERLEQEPRGHRQQHRQCQHLSARRSRVPSSPTSTPRRSAAPAPRRSASAPTWRRWRSSSRRATSRRPTNPMDLAINGAGFFQVSDGDGLGDLHAQRPVQGRPRRLHRQQQRAAPDGLPGRRARRDPARAGRAAAAAHRRHRAQPDAARAAGDEPRRAAGHPSTTCRPAAPQIDFNDADTYNNATSLTVYDAKGQEVALTYYFQKDGDRHLERLRHRQRQFGGRHRRAAAADRHAALCRPTAAALISPVGPVSFDIPASTNAAGAETMAITGVELDLGGATQFGVGLRRHRHAPGRLFGRPADLDRGRGQRHRVGALLERPVAARPARSRSRTSATRRACSRSATTPGRAAIASGDPVRRRARRRQPGRAAGRRAGGVQRRPDRRAGQHDHRAAHLPGQRADDQDQDQVLQTLVNLR